MPDTSNFVERKKKYVNYFVSVTNYTYKEFAAALGISRQYLWNIIHSQKKIPPSFLLRIIIIFPYLNIKFHEYIDIINLPWNAKRKKYCKKKM